MIAAPLCVINARLVLPQGAPITGALRTERDRIAPSLNELLPRLRG